MTDARNAAAAVVLPDGRVLVVGGTQHESRILTAEIYDPAARTFHPTSTHMHSAYQEIKAFVLPDGRVLICGGSPSPASEVYDPATDMFTATAPPSISHYSAAAVQLRDGRVLLAGGNDDKFDPIGNVEIFDPATNSWTADGNLALARADHAAALLPDGRVLIVGGQTLTDRVDSEIFDPATQTSTVIPDSTYSQPIPVPLPNGKVVIFEAGRIDEFDESTETYTKLADFLPTAGQMVTLLGNGLLMAAGGLDARGSGPSSLILLVDPASGAIVPGGRLPGPRLSATSTLLPDGSVLIAGGLDASGQSTAAAAVYTFSPLRHRSTQP